MHFKRKLRPKCVPFTAVALSILGNMGEAEGQFD